MFHAFRKALVLGGALLVLAACTGGNHMVATAKDANLALEESTNEMLLLNIIRASQQKPMYFTGLADVSMTDTAKLAGTLKLPFGGDATSAFDFSPSFTFEARPGFKVQILDNKEFINAIHTPASLDTLCFFLSFGWPAEFLLYVFTESVVAHGTRLPNVAFSVAKTEERYGAKAPAKIIEKKRGLADFRGQVEHLAGQPKVISVDIKRVPVGPVLAAAAVEHRQVLMQILALKEKGISLEDACQVSRKIASGQSNISLPAGFLNGVNCVAGAAKKYVTLKFASKKVLAYKVKKPDGTMVSCTVATSMRTVKERAAASNECVIDQINLRSPQGMLYFLGQIARAYAHDGTKPNKPVGVPGLFRRGVSLFAVWKGQADGKTALSVEYDSETYNVPAKENNLSMLSLNRISQLISLLKDPKNIPTSSTINIFAN